MPDRYQTVLLFGPPGAGKGTQGKILANIPGFFHMSTGEMFRHLDLSSPLGQTFVEYSNRGELVPDEVTIELWKENIQAYSVLGLFKPKDDLLVLDGLPRNARQARLMDEYIEVLEIIHLVCPDRAAMIDRLKRRALKENRRDDAKEDVIARRWEVYENETKPVLEHYDPALVKPVNAMGPPSMVLTSVLQVLVPVQDKHFRSVGEFDTEL